MAGHDHGAGEAHDHAAGVSLLRLTTASSRPGSIRLRTGQAVEAQASGPVVSAEHAG